MSVATLRRLAVLCLCALWPAAASALPAQLAHEAYLVDDAGEPLAGEHRVGVRLYHQSLGGMPFYDELHPAVEVFAGYAFFEIGAFGALPAAEFRDAVFLGLTVDGAEELSPRVEFLRVPVALQAEVATQVTGSVDVTALTVGGVAVVDAAGDWVGPTDTLRGPAGPQGVEGPAGPLGPQGPQGPAGDGGAADTPQQVRDKIRQVDGAGSGIDADALDGAQLASFPTTPAAMLALILQADGAGSGLDADRLDGVPLGDFPRTGADVRVRVITADGAGSGLDGDLLDGLDSAAFARTPAQIRDLILAVDGAGSGVDADLLDGLDSAALLRQDGDVRVGGALGVTGTLSVDRVAPGFRVLGRNGAPGACAAGRLGQVYYDTGAGAFFACTASGWTDLAGQAQVADPTLPRAAVLPHTPFSSSKPAGWSNLGYDVGFTKQAAGSWLKVSFRTTLGHHMVGHGSACAYRVVIDGGSAQREFRSHTSTAPGWRLEPHAMSWFVPNIGAGRHTASVQIISRGGSANHCYTGWPEATTAGFVYVEEIAADRIGVTRHMGDTRHTPNGWSDVPGRSVTYNKREAGSALEVHFADNLGYHQQGRGSWGCRWRLTMDGGAVGRSFSSHTNSSRSGWRIEGKEHFWRLDGVAAGNHTFRVQVYRPNSDSTSECLAGWPNGGVANALAVVEKAPGNVAVRRRMGDTRYTPGSFSELPSREVVHTKQANGSRVRIRYADDLGYHMVGHSYGCRWRLTVDGAPTGLHYSSHTSTASGWRIDPHLLEWVVGGVSAGLHTYRIEVDRPNAGSASECLAGWPNNDTENLLLVEEIE